MFEKNYDRIQNVNLNLHFPMYKNLVFWKFLSIRVKVLFCFGKECHKFRNNSMGRGREHVDKNFEWDKKCRLELEKATSNKLIADCFEMSKKHISGMIWSNYDKGFKKWS